MKVGREGLRAFYGRYLQRCNEHRFDELSEFVDNDVNGPAEGLDRYVEGLRAVVEAFPDYQWDLQRLLIDGHWLAARLYGIGTHTSPFRGIAATGRVIRTQELVIYRIANGRIAECWGDLGSTVRDELVSGSPLHSQHERQMALPTGWDPLQGFGNDPAPNTGRADGSGSRPQA